MPNTDNRQSIVETNLLAPFGSFWILFNYIDFLNRQQQHTAVTHAHKSFEIHIVVEGDVVLTIEDKDYVMTSGDFAWLSPNLQHAKISRKAGVTQAILNFNICPLDIEMGKRKYYRISEDYQIFNFMNETKYWIGKDNQGCIDTLLKLIDARSEKKLGYEIESQYLLSNLMMSVLRSMGLEDSKKNPEEKSNDNSKLAVDIMEFIYAHYSEEITMENIGKLFSLSERQLSRLLQLYYKNSLNKILNECRIINAKILLSQTGNSIEMISEKVGFKSVPYFHKRFKANMGMTASEYRQKCINSNSHASNIQSE